MGDPTLLQCRRNNQRFKMWSLLIATALFSLEVSTSVVVPRKVLNDGNTIPILGFGTYIEGDDFQRIRQAINWAIEAGYRHIDTASIYENEALIGEGLKDVFSKGLVKREDLFITTKLAGDSHLREQVVPALRASLQRLGLDYVDLYLIHFPTAFHPNFTASNLDFLPTWEGMQDAQKLGLTKSIGVANFQIKDLDRLAANSEVKPVVNQIEVHPAYTNYPLVDHTFSLGIDVMAYSPLGFLATREKKGSPPFIDDPVVKAIGDKYGKSTTQVVLRYSIDRNIIPIVKSTKKERLEQNIDVFDFQLTPEEIRTLDGFNKNDKYIQETF